MPKRLVICCDGTWNTPDQVRGGAPAPTNVAKVALAVAREDVIGQEQRTFYHRGVGTGRWDRVRGGMVGAGLSDNVREAYRFVVRNYEPGDELYFFGFSRGAYTARSTVGLLRNCGILRPGNIDRVDEAYDLYRSRRPDAHPRSIESKLFRRSHSFETRVRFIGVWDTVGALGIPLNGLRLVNFVNRRWQFHDTDLSASVESAYQALAIDEKRGPFRPAIWTQPKAGYGQKIEQAWFAGVHCDIGGGYEDTALSEIALLWMVDRARSQGLAFEPGTFTQVGSGTEALRRTGEHVSPDALGQLHESRKRFYRLLPRFVRGIGTTDGTHEHVASSAFERHQLMEGYAPANLVGYLGGKSPRILPVDSRRRRPGRQATNALDGEAVT
jgi:uncharacterized protein (DUF2235 family)